MKFWEGWLGNMIKALVVAVTYGGLIMILGYDKGLALATGLICYTVIAFRD